MKQNGLIAMLFAIAMYILMTACAVLFKDAEGTFYMVIFIGSFTFGTISAFVGIYQAYVQAKSLKGQKSSEQEKTDETIGNDGR